MPPCHRETDLRYCNAQTIVTNQETVWVNNLKWAVEGDKDTHPEGGDLIAVYGLLNVFINNILVICAPGDIADPDNKPLCPHPGCYLTDYPYTGSPNTFVYGGAGGG